MVGFTHVHEPGVFIYGLGPSVSGEEMSRNSNERGKRRGGSRVPPARIPKKRRHRDREGRGEERDRKKPRLNSSQRSSQRPGTNSRSSGATNVSKTSSRTGKPDAAVRDRDSREPGIPATTYAKKAGSRQSKPVTLHSDVWTIPNKLLPCLQGHPWSRYVTVMDGSGFFPADFSFNPAAKDIFLRPWEDFVCGLLLNPPFSIWDRCAEHLLQIASTLKVYFWVIAPNQPKYWWYQKWFRNTRNRPYCRLDLSFPLAFQRGASGSPADVAPHRTSIFILGLRGPDCVVKNDASGYLYPDLVWLRKIQRLNSLSIDSSPGTNPTIEARLDALEAAETYRRVEGMPDFLLDFLAPPLPVIPVSTSESDDSIFSADKKLHLAPFMAKGSKVVSRADRRSRRIVRTMADQLRLRPKLAKGKKYWPDPSAVPVMCRICHKRNHPEEKCTKRILRESECIFSSHYEMWVFRYITYAHTPMIGRRRRANEGILPWMTSELRRIREDAQHFRTNCVKWVRQQSGDPNFVWRTLPTFNFSEMANGLDFWAAIGTPKYCLQRIVNGFRVELTDPDISFEISSGLWAKAFRL